MPGSAKESTERPIILLVEDEPSVRRSLQLLLYAQGYEIRSYASGTALINDPLADQAVCLVADYRMPEIDGLAVLRALRARGWRKPALLITAHHSAELVRQAMDEGFSSVLEKPLREHMLADTIARDVARWHPAP